MPTAVTWNNSARNIPIAGELNWASLSDFLNDLANNAQTTNFQKFAMRVATTTPITVSATTDCVVVSKLSVPAAVAVNLPAGVNGQVFAIVDGTGDAATNNITVTPNGGQTINGAASFVINQNRQAIIIAYASTGTDWSIVANIGGGTVDIASDQTITGQKTFTKGVYNSQSSPGNFGIDAKNGILVNYTIDSGETVTLTTSAYLAVITALTVNGTLTVTSGTVRVL